MREKKQPPFYARAYCKLYMMLLDLNLVFHFIKHGVACAMKRPTSNPTFNWHECRLLQFEREKHFVHTLFRLFQVTSIETGRVNEDKTYRISMKTHSYKEESNCKCWMPLEHLPKTYVYPIDGSIALNVRWDATTGECLHTLTLGLVDNHVTSGYLCPVHCFTEGQVSIGWSGFRRVAGHFQTEFW